MEKYKYNLFLSVKHAILKQIKEKKYDLRIAKLKRAKFVRTFIKFVK